MPTSAPASPPISKGLFQAYIDIARHGWSSVSEISRRTGRSRNSVAAALANLRAARLIETSDSVPAKARVVEAPAAEAAVLRDRIEAAKTVFEETVAC